MTFKNLIYISAFLIMAPYCFGQKVKIKDNLILVDNEPYVKKSKTGISTDSYSLFTLKNNKEVIFVLDVPPQTEGEIRYPYYHYLVKFIGTKKEVRFGDNRIKKLIQELYKNNVISDSGLNLNQVDTFIEKYK